MTFANIIGRPVGIMAAGPRDESMANRGFSEEPGRNRFVLVAGDAQRIWPRLQKSLNGSPGVTLLQTEAAVGEALGEAQSLAPCVLIADLEFLANPSIPADFARKTDFGRAVSVIVLTDRTDEQSLEMLLRAGCMGFLAPDPSVPTLRKAIDAVSSGEYWAPRKLLSRVFQRHLADSAGRRFTTRETEIMNLVAEGYTNKEMAETLQISRETVRWHMRMLYAKLGVHDRDVAASKVLKTKKS